ncbi:replication protein [Neobacillus sp. PS3-34]|uniref:replication protein n=1 Tax=Neobacillus sp. PS3-34 TaxID=3070678 RepID=UPI0027DF4507|nr:replication protein [Neobacillus sp. PS3-34]WML48507.1 replication protein [Neobacillus sp. PS3-34]
MTNLLINEHPLIVLPSLAIKIGLNEAVVLQQMHYWLESSKHVIEGRKWIYNTYKDWQMQMPFWHENTIRKTILSLEQKGYLISANWNRSKIDKTKWYTIDYIKLAEMEETSMIVTEVSTHILEPSSQQELSLEETTIVPPIPEITTEITSKTTTKEHIPFAEIIDYLNLKTQTNYRYSSNKTQELIRPDGEKDLQLGTLSK